MQANKNKYMSILTLRHFSKSAWPTHSYTATMTLFAQKMKICSTTFGRTLAKDYHDWSNLDQFWARLPTLFHFWSFLFNVSTKLTKWTVKQPLDLHSIHNPSFPSRGPHTLQTCQPPCRCLRPWAGCSRRICGDFQTIGFCCSGQEETIEMMNWVMNDLFG